jgi:hypothetical protein
MPDGHSYSHSRQHPNIFLGLDPGASGGLAAITPNSVHTSAMPKTMADILEWLYDWRPENLSADDSVTACIELVTGYVKPFKGKGGGGNTGSSQFKFGTNNGALLMALTAAQIPFATVSPATWQKGVGIAPRRKAVKGRGGETPTAWKNRLKARAQGLHPGIAITLATADALLIAEYCRRFHLGILQKLDKTGLVDVDYY